METQDERRNSSLLAPVIELPIRDGNDEEELINILKEVVIELPIRDGNQDMGGYINLACEVIELPIRDGNRCLKYKKIILI